LLQNEIQRVKCKVVQLLIEGVEQETPSFMTLIVELYFPI